MEKFSAGKVHRIYCPGRACSTYCIHVFVLPRFFLPSLFFFLSFFPFRYNAVKNERLATFLFSVRTHLFYNWKFTLNIRGTGARIKTLTTPPSYVTQDGPLNRIVSALFFPPAPRAARICAKKATLLHASVIAITILHGARCYDLCLKKKNERIERRDFSHHYWTFSFFHLKSLKIKRMKINNRLKLVYMSEMSHEAQVHSEEEYYCMFRKLYLEI